MLWVPRTFQCRPCIGSWACGDRRYLAGAVLARSVAALVSIPAASHHHLHLARQACALSRGQRNSFLEMSMFRHVFTLELASVCILLGLPALGQTSSQKSSVQLEPTADDRDPIAIVEAGAATSWNFSGGAATFAPNLAAETTPIENWLELEAGVSPFYTRSAREWDADLLFKKPWTISRKAEFMLGVGPEWIHLTQNGKTSNAVAGEIAADFMFWPTGKHRFGWYLEPAYDYSFAGGHQKSIGMSAGLLIGFR